MLASFPLMMENKETLPPFIHPLMLPAGIENAVETPSEPLVNCMSIVQMCRSMGKSRNGFIWRTVKMELEKMSVEHERYSDWKLLACQQVLLIYVIMRIQEGQLDDSNVDGLLMSTLARVSDVVVHRIGDSEYQYGVARIADTHADWVFHESRRRLCAVSRFINMVVDVDGSVEFCSLLDGFAIIPLPAPRTLWAANTSSTWRRDFDTFLRDRRLYGLGMDGQLKSLEQQGHLEVLIKPVNWENWLATQDALGMMSMLAGSLLEASGNKDVRASQ